MASKLIFKESDSWGDSSKGANSPDMHFSFKKTPKAKKEKKAKKRKHSEQETDPEAGKFVRAPRFYGLEDDDNVEQFSSEVKQVKNKRKRKHEETNGTLESDGITPEKKAKKGVQPSANDELQQPLSYSDKLRESLKGSRFRYINECMYKQTGSDSLKLFAEDPSAFEAYHEGYRHQISQWPMNPLDRIINNIKRM